MRNDIMHIKRSIIHSSAANWALLVDVFLVLLSFVLDRIFDKNKGLNVFWIIIAIIGVATPIFILIYHSLKIKRIEQISRRVLNTKELVQMFDDEICYAIMSAESFYQKLKRTEKIDSRQTALLIEFYGIEVSYYLNKSVHLILKMDNNLTEVLNENDITKNHISKERLINSISLIALLYEDLFSFIKTHSTDLYSFSVTFKLNDAIKKYNALKAFADRRKKIIGINTTIAFSKY